MQDYELGYLILPSIAEGELSSVVDQLKAIVAKAGGKEIEGEAPFKYDLAYTMTKTVGSTRYVVSDAYLGWMKFELEPEAVELVKGSAEKMGEILRFLLVKAPRQTFFTFAKARAAIAEKEAEALEAAETRPAEEAVVE